MGNNVHQQLKDYLLEHTSAPLSAIESLLVLTEAAPDLRLFSKVIRNLKNILPFLLQIDPEEWHQDQISEWLGLCSFIEEHTGRLNQIIHKFSQRDRQGKGHPMRGLMETYPIYSVLFESPPNKGSADQFHHLQAHILNANSIFREIESGHPEKNYDETRYAVGRELRKMQPGSAS